MRTRSGKVYNYNNAANYWNYVLPAVTAALGAGGIKGATKLLTSGKGNNGSKKPTRQPSKPLGFTVNPSVDVLFKRTRPRTANTAYLAGKYGRLKQRPLKSRKKRQMRKFDVLGTRVNWEEGLEYTDPNMVYVGHGLPIRRIFEQFTRSLYRSIMKVANHDFANWYDKPDLPVGTAQPAFRLYYSNDKGVQTVGSKAITDLTSHNSMWAQFDSWLFDYYIDNALVGSGIWLQSFRMIKLVLLFGQDVSNPGYYVDSYELPLQGAVARFRAQQSMKVQNVTLSADGHDQDSDIYNVPINGRLYEASGNSLKFKFGGYKALTTTTLYVGQFTSAIIRGKAQTENVPAEPPEAYELSNCKSFKKVSINPGKIKTSSCMSEFSCNIDRFFVICSTAIRGDGVGPVFSNQEHPFGKCRVMALEKVIGNILGTESPIKLRLEVDTKMSCYIKTKKKVQLCPLNYVI